MAGKSGAPPTETIAGWLQHADPRVRAKGVKAASESRDRALAGATVTALQAETVKELRSGFLQLIGILGLREHGQVLASYLASPEAEDRYRALQAIARIGDPSLAWTIVVGVSDTDSKVSRMCADMLIRGKEKLHVLLEKMLASEKRRLRVGAVKAAANLMSSKMSDFLRRAVEDLDSEIREFALDGLKRFAKLGNDKAVQHLADLGYDVRKP